MWETRASRPPRPLGPDFPVEAYAAREADGRGNSSAEDVAYSERLHSQQDNLPSVGCEVRG